MLRPGYQGGAHWGCGGSGLTGTHPVKGESVGKLIHNILESDPPALRAHRPDLPERLDEIVLRCLRKRRGRRFQSFADLARALTDVRELVEEQYADADAYRCEQCGYRTMHSYGACPVCAGTMISMQEPEVPVGQELRAEVEAGPAPEPAEEEIQAATDEEPPAAPGADEDEPPPGGPDHSDSAS